MDGVAAVILGGGRGERLKPLTRFRAKPAVPFAGMYRLVDVPISNCLHAGIDRIYVLTQYRSMSLNRHVAQAYRFDAFSDGHVTVMAAEQTDHGSDGSDWYRGTADAVRKQFERIDVEDDGDVVVLSGDQIYVMAMEEFVLFHRVSEADVTIAATRVTAEDAKRFGVMRVDEDHKITEFAEKPQDPDTIERFVAPDAKGDKTHLGSMGIYVFKKKVLQELLSSTDEDDFGKHVLPMALKQGLKLVSYPFDGYWEDVGTIASLHRVNLHLTEPVPDFSLFQEQAKLYTRQRFLPPAKIGDAVVQRALISGGAIIGDGATVQQSVIGIRTVIGPRCVLDRVVHNGNGRYDFDGTNDIRMGIGADSVLRKVIIDRDARIGRNVHLVNRDGLSEFNDGTIVVRDGIIVVPARAVIPDGYTF